MQVSPVSLPPTWSSTWPAGSPSRPLQFDSHVSQMAPSTSNLPVARSPSTSLAVASIQPTTRVPTSSRLRVLRSSHWVGPKASASRASESTASPSSTLPTVPPPTQIRHRYSSQPLTLVVQRVDPPHCSRRSTPRATCWSSSTIRTMSASSTQASPTAHLSSMSSSTASLRVLPSAHRSRTRSCPVSGVTHSVAQSQASVSSPLSSAVTHSKTTRATPTFPRANTSAW